MWRVYLLDDEGRVVDTYIIEVFNRRNLRGELAALIDQSRYATRAVAEAFEPAMSTIG
jgi:hypothetical protein